MGSRYIVQGISIEKRTQLTTLPQQLAHCEEALTSQLPSAVRNAPFFSLSPLNNCYKLVGKTHMNFDCISME